MRGGSTNAFGVFDGIMDVVVCGGFTKNIVLGGAYLDRGLLDHNALCADTVSSHSYPGKGGADCKSTDSNELDSDISVEFACRVVAENYGSVRRSVTERVIIAVFL